MPEVGLFKCDHGIYGDFVNDATGEKLTVERLCDLVLGHLGPHVTEDGFTWEDPE